MRDPDHGRLGDAPASVHSGQGRGIQTTRGFTGNFADKDAAARAIQGHIADPLGLDVETAAAGIRRIVDSQMADTLRELTIDKGTTRATSRSTLTVTPDRRTAPGSAPNSGSARSSYRRRPWCIPLWSPRPRRAALVPAEHPADRRQMGRARRAAARRSLR
ncbi:hydantoinase/oxoprolinase family protein [Streptomyces sp. S465]|uniref:hydantoinase/oxoprolinase family protein n=1 Tax=Streptomyces sp. S465 TaxID=2979468 RepID=UPI003FCE026E